MVSKTHHIYLAKSLKMYRDGYRCGYLQRVSPWAIGDNTLVGSAWNGLKLYYFRNDLGTRGLKSSQYYFGVPYYTVIANSINIPPNPTLTVKATILYPYRNRHSDLVETFNDPFRNSSYPKGQNKLGNLKTEGF